MDALQNSAGTLLISDELLAVFDRILDDLEAFVQFGAASVFLEDAGKLHLVTNRHAPANRVGFVYPVVDLPLYQEVVSTQAPLIIPRVDQEPRFRNFWQDSTIQTWMGIPLVVNGTVKGMISLISQQPGCFSERDGYLAQTFINQAALAVEKAEVAAALAVEKHNLEVLYRISQSLTEVLDPVEVAQKAVQLLTEALGGCHVGIYLLEHPGATRLKAAAISDRTPELLEAAQTLPFLTLGVGMIGSVAAERKPVIAPDVFKEPRWLPVPGVGEEIQSQAAIPLLVRNELVGVMTLASQSQGFFTPADLPKLSLFAAPIGLALQNARLFAAERARRQEAETLRNATTTLVLNLDLRQVLQELLERLQQVVPLDSACVMLLKQNQLQAVAGIGLPCPELVIGQSFPSDNDLLRQLARERKAIFYPDIRVVPSYQAWGGTDYVRAWMGVPLLHGGILIGYITLDSRQVGTYGEAEANLAQAFANQATITIVNAQLLQDSQRSVAQQRAVSEILRQLNGTSSVAEVLPSIAPRLVELTRCDAVDLLHFDANAGTISGERYVDGDAAPTLRPVQWLVEESAAFATLQQGRIHQTPDLHAEAAHAAEAAAWADGYTARMAAPLQLNQRLLGVLQLLWRAPEHARECNVASFAQVADAIAMAVEKNSLFTQTRQRVDEMETLSDFALTLRPLETHQEIMQASLQYVLDTFRGTQSCIAFPAAEPGYLEIVLTAGVEIPDQMLHFSDQNSMFGYVFRTRQPFLASNIFHESVANAQSMIPWRAAGYHAASSIFAPLHTGDEVIGVIAVVSGNQARIYTQDDMHLLTAMAGIVGTALHRSSVLETLEQRVLERTRDLANANARLQELDRLKSEFVANVSHELRTPLTNIRFYLDLLNRGRVEKRQKYLEILESETNRLYTLIESVLDLSRLTANRAQGIFKTVAVDLAIVAKEVYQNHLPLAVAKGIEFHCHVACPQLIVDGDRNHLVQVMTNLVANGIHYTASGGHVHLYIQPGRDDGVEIQVRDTGMGIDACDLAHLFERFYRSQRTTEMGIPGTGLGLSIVKEIVDLHRGRVGVESTPGIGSTFTVWLPSRQPGQDSPTLDLPADTRAH